VLLINMLFRMGASGDQERAREEEARRYFDEHGEWPEDPPPNPRDRGRGRRWTLPAGVVLPGEDDEQRD
jgi:hypothetical protein